MRSSPLLTTGLTLCMTMFGITPAGAQTEADVWRDANEGNVLAAKKAVASERTVVPQAYRTLRLNWDAFRKTVAAVRQEFAGGNESDAELVLPLPDGTFARFTVQESPLMEEKLAAKFPDMKTYVARGIDDPRLSARLDQTPQGFHAIIFSDKGSVYIDPFWRDDTEHYVSYRRRDFSDPTKSLNCQVPEKVGDLENLPKRPATAQRPTGASLRTFRLALACTGEYATAAGGGTLNKTLGAMLTSVNRVSAVYERDLAIRLKLVNNNDLLVFLDPATDPYTNSNGSTMLGENQTKIDAVIGNANYDIGHVFSTGGGGVAGLGVVGRAGQKAQGVTGRSNPVGDPFDIDYVSHEMGHQFGADHPFNATSGSCAGTNRNGPTAYEVGSGTTIMAYAGICSPQNIATNSDDYFHTISYDEIDAYTTTGAGNVGVSTATGNTAPTIAALGSFTIPSQTPFALTASATDPDAGDVLTFCWEEFDLGAAQDPTASPRDNGSSPIFRSFDPTPKPTRLFPSLTYILNNANVPPATIGSFASGEFLPTTDRTMTFRVTVRDNHLGGGGSNYGSMTVTSVSTAGPFAITSQNIAATIAGGSVQTVTWAVANTSVAPVSCANVKISLSADGGNTYPFVLAASVPNNGSANITIPNTANVATTQGRIKVEAVGNIFFDVSDANLTITSTNTAPTLAITGSVTVQRGTPTATTATVATVSDTNTPITASISNAPADSTITAIISGGNVNVSARADSSLVTTLTSRTYPVTLTVTDSLGSTTSGTFNFIVQPNPAPTLGTYADQNIANGGSVTAAPTAPPADANNNLGATPVSVSPTTLPGGTTLTVNQTTGAVTATTVAASTPGTYLIRVTVQDTSGAAVVQSFNLTVLATNPIVVAGTASAPTAENCVPANGAVDPAETVTVNFSLSNNGGGPTTNLVATLQNTGGVAPVTVSQNYGVIAASGNVSRAFTFTASGVCGGTITATFQLQDGATNLGTAAFTIRLGATVGLGTSAFENFDGVTAPALPVNWTSTAASGTPVAWATSTSTPDSAPNSVFATPTSTVSDNRLESPNFPVSSASAQITFKHRWSTESGFDGGVLEIAINGGAFNDIVTAGGSFAAGGYNGTISAGSSSSPIPGRAAWTGSANTSYTTTTANLPASAAGQNVRLRFRLACDGSVNATGPVWRIDSISLTDTAYACCGLSPVFTSAAPPAATVGTVYNHTFTTNGTPPPSFSITGGILPAGITLAGASLSGTPTVPGIYPGITITAANGLAPNGTQTFGLTVNDTFEHFIANLGIVGANAIATADPDRDGIKNIAEYGLHTVPNVPNFTGLPVVQRKNYAGTIHLSMTFTRVTTATDLTYIVQASPDLSNWIDVGTSIGGVQTSGPGFIVETGTAPVLTVEVRDPVAYNATTAPIRFMRLKIFKTANP